MQTWMEAWAMNAKLHMFFRLYKYFRLRNGLGPRARPEPHSAACEPCGAHWCTVLSLLDILPGGGSAPSGRPRGRAHAPRRRLALLCLAVFACGGAAHAAGYPSRPIRMIVPYSAGGGIDATARLFAKAMGQELHASIVVENRPGAGGMIGAEAVVRAAPDGYTVLFSGNPELGSSPRFYGHAPYDPIEDLRPVALVAESPTVVVAAASLQAATLRDALALGRKDPTLLTVATAGVGTTHHFALEALRHKSGVNLLHVPYKGAAPATMAVLGGQTQMAIVGLPPALPYIKSGRLRAYAVLQPQRSPFLPAVPTIEQATGMHGLDFFATWYGLMLPARTPDAVAAVLEKAARRVLAEPQLARALAAQGTEVRPLFGADFARRIRREWDLYGELAQQYGITAAHGAKAGPAR
jgi:tripartite-type tricarboxylate transporter receptor subunit TctC